MFHTLISIIVFISILIGKAITVISLIIILGFISKLFVYTFFYGNYLIVTTKQKDNRHA